MHEKIFGESSSDKPHFDHARSSGLSRIANASLDTERAPMDWFAGIRENQSVESYEREKNPEERQIIAGILRAMPDFVRAYGDNPVEDISEANTACLLHNYMLYPLRDRALLVDAIAIAEKVVAIAKITVHALRLILKAVLFPFDHEIEVESIRPYA